MTDNFPSWSKKWWAGLKKLASPKGRSGLTGNAKNPLHSNEFIIIGSTAEGAVKATALGLLQRGKKVTVLTDAVGSHNKREAKLALRKVEAKGARLIETKRVAGVSHLRHIGICGCESCKGLTRKTSLGLKEVI